MSEKPKIEEREDGPLVVKNITRLIGPDGVEIKVRPVMALCRCGASKNKPFCDGSHEHIGFKSEREDVARRDKVFTYDGKDITVHYNRLLCSHAAECSARLQSVFDPSRKPWVVPDNGTSDAVKAVVAACPSGALRYSEPAKSPEHIATDEVCIKIEKNGPYKIENVDVDDVRWADGACKDKYVLCRCGKSGNKPFCDGAHYDVGWRDEE